MKRVYAKTFLILFLGIASTVFAQNSVSIDLQKNSSLVINGSTNLLTFKLIQNGDKLLRKTQMIKTTQTKTKVFLSVNKLSIAVKNFSSNNAIALDGFLDLLQADKYPNLNVELDYIETSAIDKWEDTTTKALVSITITGVTKQYLIPFIVNKSGAEYTIIGNKNLNIRDFGLVPPVRMFGLVKVNEMINIDFHLICKIAIATPSV